MSIISTVLFFSYIKIILITFYIYIVPIRFIFIWIQIENCIHMYYYVYIEILFNFIKSILLGGYVMSSHVYQESSFRTRDFVICGILMALTTVMTMIVQIPVVGAHGYVNMGDTVVLFSGLYLGKKHGGLIGGVGSALADIISGYAVYAPITLITKGAEGYICGLIAEKVSGKKGQVLGAVVGGIIMVSGYFIGEIFLYGIKTSLAAVPANSMQAIFGIVTSLLIYTGVVKSIGKYR